MGASSNRRHPAAPRGSGVIPSGRGGERDVIGAITALNAANKRLHELNDDRLLSIRESISNQIGVLKNFPYPDWVGISLDLDNILNA